MQKLSQVNFAKIVIITIFMILIKEVVPQYLIQDPSLKFMYKMAFLGILSVIFLGYIIVWFRRKGVHSADDIAIFSVLSFWTFGAWMQYLGVFH